MANSPSHKFGQIIGDMMEEALESFLGTFAKKHDLFLDKIGPRPARKGKKVSWQDHFGNKHDLDYVLEINGTDEKIGKPIAFIESAWRSYTKHSRNKAQEIQGALIPLSETFSHQNPFLGVVLGGVFTSGSLKQLESLGFSILYFEKAEIAEAFSHVGIDAKFDEGTSDNEIKQKIKQWEELSNQEKILVKEKLVKINSKKIKIFIQELTRTIERKITFVTIIPFHGRSNELKSIPDAITFVNNYDVDLPVSGFLGFEIEIRYNNKDTIKATFTDKKLALRFLNGYK